MGNFATEIKSKSILNKDYKIEKDGETSEAYELCLEEGDKNTLIKLVKETGNIIFTTIIKMC